MGSQMRMAGVWMILCVLLIPWSGAHASLDKIPRHSAVLPDDCNGIKNPDVVCDSDDDPADQPKAQGYTSLANPAIGQTITGTSDDPLSVFSRRPLDHFIIPEGGAFLDPLHDDPHYGVDYANPDDYLNGKQTYFYPIGPGYVTTRSTCTMCFADGDLQGRVSWKWPQYNFGWGSLVLVETPYRPEVSIYTMYAHLNRDLVSLGDYVTPDHVIGVVGSSGYSEEMHLHLELRFGPPSQFWNADFSQPETLDRWLATMFVSPALLVFPENHPSFVTTLAEWIALQRDGNSIP